jgi:hypothetical protein
MKSGSIFRLLFLLTVGNLSAWSSIASAGPDGCHGNACEFIQLSVNDECLTVTNTSPNKTITVQWGIYGPFSLRPDQSNTIMFQGRCVGTTIAEALNATFSGRAPTPAPALQPSPQWTFADAEVRDIMVRTCLINMPAYVVWLDPDGSLQGPIRVSVDPSWPQGAPIVVPGTGGTTASTRYRTAWVYAETEQGAIIGGDSTPQNTDKVFRFSEDQQRDYHLPRSSRFAAVRLTDAQWLGEIADSYVYKAWRADLTCP